MTSAATLRTTLIIVVLLLISLSANSSVIFLKKEGGIYTLPVKINRVITLDFILDSGASEVCIPADVVMTLLRAHTIEEADFLPGKSYLLADGSVARSRRFIIRELEMDGIKIHNVPAMISPVRGDLLLGQSFLQKLDSWAIDNKRHALVVGNSIDLVEGYQGRHKKSIAAPGSKEKDQTQVHLRRINLPYIPGMTITQKEELNNKGDLLLKEARQVPSLEALAKTHNLFIEDLGVIALSDLDPDLAKVLSRLKPGEFTSYKTYKGFQLIQLISVETKQTSKPQEREENNTLTSEDEIKVGKLLLRGFLLLSDGNYPSAIEVYKKVIQLDPQNVAAHEKLGKMYCKIGRYNEAMNEYKYLKSLDPESAERLAIEIYKNFKRQ